jgi:hypothetical protein
MKTHSCKIDNNWNRSFESACVGITSPSGRTAWIRKASIETATDLDILYQKCVATPDGGMVELTYSEMLAIARMANLKIK